MPGEYQGPSKEDASFLFPKKENLENLPEEIDWDAMKNTYESLTDEDKEKMAAELRKLKIQFPK